MSNTLIFYLLSPHKAMQAPRLDCWTPVRRASCRSSPNTSGDGLANWDDSRVAAVGIVMMMMMMMMMMMISKFNGTSTPKESYSAKNESKQSPLEKNVRSNECNFQGKMSSHILKKRSSNEQGNAHYGPRPAKVAG